jgi:undecaprenyl-diphosphatase
MVKAQTAASFVLSLALLAAAVALALAVDQDWLPDEAGVIREVQSWALPGQTLSDAVRLVTGTALVVAAGLAIAALHWLTRDRRTAAVLIVALLMLLVLQTALKEMVDRPRPSEVEAGIEVRASQTSPSFPSGHVMGPMLVYGWAAYALLRRPLHAATDSRHARIGAGASTQTLRRALAVVTLIILLLTGIVNVWLGVHWPSDVVGGYLWGAVLLLPAIAVAQRP